MSTRVLRLAVSLRDPREPTAVGFASGVSELRVSDPATGFSLWVRSSHDVDANAAVPGCCSRTEAATRTAGAEAAGFTPHR